MYNRMNNARSRDSLFSGAPSRLQVRTRLICAGKGVLSLSAEGCDALRTTGQRKETAM